MAIWDLSLNVLLSLKMHILMRISNSSLGRGNAHLIQKILQLSPSSDAIIVDTVDDGVQLDLERNAIGVDGVELKTWSNVSIPSQTKLTNKQISLPGSSCSQAQYS